MINVNAPLPDYIYYRLPGRAAVLEQRIPVSSRRWVDALSVRRLPGPVGTLAGGGRVELTRSDVFAVANQDLTPDAAVQLLWYSMAWGLGRRAPRLHTRLDAIVHDRNGASRLTEAWRSVRDAGDPETAYSILTTARGAGQIEWLGPAFSTKFLYFSQGEAATPTHVILDSVVATKLTKLPDVWPDAPTAGWWPSTYSAYCNLMQRWAAEASDRSCREVRADEIEFTVFTEPTPE